MKKMIVPFSCGTQAMDWQYHNCDQCKRAYKPKKGELPDFEETEKLVAQGRECKMKLHLDFGFVIGEIPEDIGKQIGLNEAGGLKESCMMFIEDNGRGWEGEEEQKPVDIIPDNQLCLPFLMDEIINSNCEQEKIILKNEHS